MTCFSVRPPTADRPMTGFRPGSALKQNVPGSARLLTGRALSGKKILQKLLTLFVCVIIMQFFVYDPVTRKHFLKYFLLIN